METKGKRGGRTAKKVAEAEVDNVEPETVKNGDAKKKPAPKGAKAAKQKAVAEPVEAEQVPEKKSGRKGKATAAPEVDPLESAPVVEEPAKGRKGRKAAVVPEEAVEEEPPVKKGRGRKAAEEAAPVENGNSAAKVAKGKGKGKAAKEEVAEPEPVAAPAKRGRGKAPAETKEPEEPASSPAKKSKQATKEPSPKKPSPKKAAAAEPEVVSEELDDEPVAPKAGRGRKKAAEEKQSVSPTKSPKAPAKRGRGRKAAAEPEELHERYAANDKPTAKSTKASKKRTTAPPKEPEADDVVKPLDGVTQRKRQKTEDAPAAKKPKAEKKPAAAKMNKSATDYAKLDFGLPEKEFTFKISCWNVGGLRSWVGKGGLEFFEHEQPDIMCIQETKCTDDQLPDEARHIKGYHPYWLCKPGGYAGVAIYSKKMPINVTYGLGDAEQDTDGRLLTAEYEKFFLVCVYVPNAGRKLVTLPKRMRWDEKFHQYLQDLDGKKPVIVCGDLNVAHEEIDLANPKTNKKNAGFTKEERDGMTKLLSLGFVDTFRRRYPDTKGAYTFWTYMGNARSKNVGWRLDYFLTSERLDGKVVDNVIRSEVYGSDHCPLTLFLKI